MRASFFASIICIALLAASCGSGSQKGKEAAADSTAKSSAQTVQSAVADPDTTDKIPGDQYAVNTASIATANVVRAALGTLFKDDLAKNLIPKENRKFMFFEYDLNNDSKNEIFVGLIGGYFCGSGGCTMVLLDNQGKVITVFTVTDYPVVINTTVTKGWKDLIIYSGGKNRIIRYNGKKYPSNPSVQPSYKITPGDDLPRALDHINHPYPWFTF